MSFVTNWLSYPNTRGVSAWGQKPSNLIRSARLAATTDTSLTVPSLVGMGKGLTTNSSVLAVFGYEDAATVFVANGVSADPGTDAAFVTTKSGVINPASLTVKGGDVLHFYALSQKYVTVAFYAVG